MSHVVGIKTLIKDIECAKAAAIAIGGVFHEGQRTYKWFDSWVDDSPLPRDLFDTEEEYLRVKSMKKEDRCVYMSGVLGKCDHAISFPGIQYEVGLIKKGDGYVLIWDWFDHSLCEKMSAYAADGSGRNNGGPFLQAYAKEVVKKQAKQNGWLWSEKIIKGVPVVEVTRT